MAYNEIEDLGSSLLSRGREIRKRTEKRLKKDVRTQALLGAATTGIGLVNNYLKNRANTFINENEDLVGERIRYQSALKDRDALITQYEEGSAHTGGLRGYWAEKYAEDIRTNLLGNFDESKFDEDSLNLYVQSEALKEADKYMPAFNEAYKSALSMPKMEDYDAWVRTKDGRAENVGGFLFNSLSRALSGRTQEDVDKGVVEAVANSRYGRSATKVKAFKAALDAGYSLRMAKRFGDHTPADLGITPAGITNRVSARKNRTFNFFDVTVDVPYTEVTAVVNGEARVWEEPPWAVDTETGEFVLDDDGNKTIEPHNLRAWNLYQRKKENPTLTEEEFNASIDTWTEAVDMGYQVKPTGAGRSGTGAMWGDPGIWQDYEIRGDQGQLVNVLTRFIPDIEELDVDDKIQGLTDAEIDQMKDAIRDSSTLFTAGTSGLFGDANNILEANIIGYYLAGDEDAAATLDEERRNQVIDDAYKAQYQRLAVRAKEIGQSSGLEIQDARKLVSDAFIVSIVTGMEDSDFKDFNPDARFLGFEGFQNTLILIADAEREENTVTDVKMGAAEYSVFATNVIGEIAYEEDDTVVEKLQKKRARELIGRSNRFLAQRVNLNAVNPETGDYFISDGDKYDLINTLALTGHELAGDNTISVGDLVAHWNDMSIMEGGGRPEPEPPSVDTGSPNYNPYYDPASDVYGTPEPLSYTFRGVMPWINKQLGIISGSRESVLKQQELTRLVGQIMETEGVSYEDAIFLAAKQLGGGEDEGSRQTMNTNEPEEILEQPEVAEPSGMDVELEEEDITVTEAETPIVSENERVGEDMTPSGLDITLEEEDIFPNDTLASTYIKSKEDFYSAPYWDVDHWTWGYGTAAPHDGGKDEPPPTDLTITKEEAQEELMGYIETEVLNKIENFQEEFPRYNNWTDNQIDGLTAFLYNGKPNWLKQVTANGTRTDEEIAEAMLLYHKVDDGTETGNLIPLAGLIKRREEEVAMFTRGMN